MLSSFLCARKIFYKQTEWHLNVTTSYPFDLKGKWEEGLVIPGARGGSSLPFPSSSVPAAAGAEVCLFHKHTDAPADTVFGDAAVPGKPAGKQETKLLLWLF